MNSCLYTGHVRHRRFTPVPHAFTYRLFMMYLDLKELPTVFKDYWLWSVGRGNLASFQRRDHVGDPAIPLDRAIRQLVEARTGDRLTGPIRLLTHCRYFGYVFNPVSFYFCYDAAGAHVDAIVVEITNTPWGERYCYVLSAKDNCAQGSRHRYHLDKVFHISPFIPMNVAYDWRLSEPTRKLAIHMANLRDGQPFFDATMVLQRRALSSATLAQVLVQYPLMTVTVMGAIHWQALKLWIKKVPLHPHPNITKEPLAVPMEHTPYE